MRPGGSSTKGASFERQVCRQLSLWISSGERDDVFWRTAMSGGRATIGLRSGKNRGAQAGDAQAIDALGDAFMKVFSVECKHVKTLQLGQMLAKHTGKSHDYWIKHRRESAAFKREPFMVARENRYPTLLFVTAEGLEQLGLESLPYRTIFRGCIPLWVSIKSAVYTDEVHVLDWERFLKETLPPIHLKRRKK